MKAFFAALAVGAAALIAGASAATSAPKLQHVMIGYDHAPTAADTAYLKGLGGTVRDTFASINVIAADVPANQVADAGKGQGVTYVEGDPIRTAQSFPQAGTEYSPALGNGLYGLVTTHTVEAQAAGNLGAGVKACVADTGLDTTQPDIAPNLVDTYDVFSHTEGLHATDVFRLGVAATETHATHVSGIVLGAINGTGIHGVAPKAQLLEARVLGTQPDGSVSGDTSQVMEGVQWLADHGCKVINMSLGGGDKSQSEEALYNQIRKNGTLIVVASGNDSAKQVSFPGRYQSVVTVGAVDRNSDLASFSNTGAQLDIVAPGVDNVSSFPQGQGRDAVATAGGTTYDANPAEFAGATDGITGPLVNCGVMLTATACGTAPASPWIALVQRGQISFAAKTDNAMKAGASAVILYNNTTGSLNPTLGTADDNGTPWIPVIALPQADGQAIVASGATTATARNAATAWNYDSGTSMATPHVTGVAALILGKDPKLTPDQVETILERTATNLGVPNYDTTFGWGLVNAQAALAATP